MLNVRYYYSACVGIRTADTSILCDPWFTEGIYDGAWYQFPKLDDPVDAIGAYDWIYVSHIHPDHYDPKFVHSYVAAHPDAKLLIASRGSDFLAKKMESDGFSPKRIRELTVGATEIAIVPNTTGSFPIDTALVVKHGGHAVANLNDNPFDEQQLAEIRSFIGEDRLRIALLPYTGAGPYPQTYYTDPQVLAEKAEQKRQMFFERYLRLRDALSADCNIPFAGKYLLGGHLATLNRSRGVADAVEVLALDPHAVVLADGGHASIDTDSLEPTHARTAPYDPGEVEAAIARAAAHPMDYERYLGDLPRDAIPFRSLLPQAYDRVIARSKCTSPYYFAIDLGDEWFVFDACAKSAFCEFAEKPPQQIPRSEISIDPRYLFGLLTGVFHWNNAEVGSQFRVNRVPDRYEPDAQDLLSFFHV